MQATCYNNEFENLLKYFPLNVRASLQNVKEAYKSECNEIRLRSGQPVSLTFRGKVTTLANSAITYKPESISLTQEDLGKTVRLLCDGSIYSCQDEINHGFITVGNGCRAGVCGRAVTSDGKITAVRDITSINLRIARSINGCAAEIVNYITVSGNPMPTLVVSPPGGGKTTVLRDAARSISGLGKKVAVIDERGEIGAYSMGSFGHDLGENTDVLSFYPKDKGIMTAVRTLSPDIILCDEVGDDSDIAGIFECSRLGVPLLVTAHAAGTEDIVKRPALKRLIYEGGFENLIILEGQNAPGKVKKHIKVSDILKEDKRDA